MYNVQDPPSYSSLMPEYLSSIVNDEVDEMKQAKDITHTDTYLLGVR